MKNPEFHERLEELVGTKEPFVWAKEVGIPGGTFSRIWNEGTVPKTEILTRISNFHGISLNWLVMGIGPKKMGAISPADQIKPDFCLVPRLNVEASAGPGLVPEAEDTDGALSFRREWLRKRGINPNAAAALTVRGDSMEPSIRDGDTLLLDTSIDQVKDNGIYVVVIDGMVVVKRVHMVHGGSITLISDNQFYPPETIPAPEVADVRFAGRVMWFGRSI